MIHTVIDFFQGIQKHARLDLHVWHNFLDFFDSYEKIGNPL